ncbi:hypothetical protein [Cognatishimia sp.]|uniref:hypothetical protein n=1 Tax=Cognatishimia sp. TaxID=2211648 RepID=UPI003BA896F4
MVASTPIAAVLVLAIVMLGPIRGLWVLFLTLPLGAAAALNVPSVGNVTLTDACVVAGLMAMLGRMPIGVLLNTIRPGEAGFLLVVLLIIAIISAVFFPRVFVGETDVFAIGLSQGRPAIIETGLAPSGSNYGQLARLGLGGMAFVLVASAAQLKPSETWALQVIKVATYVHVLVALVDWIGHPLGLAWVLDPLRTVDQAILVDQTFPSLRRIIGGYTEPASFGLFTMGLLGFWTRYGFENGRSVIAWAFTIILFCLALRSTSSATVSNLVMLTILFPAFYATPILKSRARLFGLLFMIGILPALYSMVSVSLGYSPMGSDLINDLIWNKAVSTSGEERMSWNRQALQNIIDTYGVGAGIGSVRTSSWLMSVLASLGVLGTAIYLWFLVEIFRSKSADTKCVSSALKWGCWAIVLQSCLTKPFPDLGVQFFLMAGLAVGLGIGQGARQREFNGRLAHALSNARMARCQ